MSAADLGLSPQMVAAMRRQLVAERGWRVGTDLENRVAILLSRWEVPGPVEQQYRIGRFRVDFAWPDRMIVLEADGWHHRAPEGAAKDRRRDSWLRSQGWVIFRVDDEHGETSLVQQMVRVCRVVRSEEPGWAERFVRSTS